MNDQSHFMINLKVDRNNKTVSTIDEKIKENFSEHSEKSFCTKCKTITHKSNNYNFALSTYLFVRISRNKWNNYKKILERTHKKISPT